MKGMILLLCITILFCSTSVVGSQTSSCTSAEKKTVNNKAPPRCPQWAQYGYCATATKFMVDNCPQSCNRRKRDNNKNNVLSSPTTRTNNTTTSSLSSSQQTDDDKAMERILRISHGHFQDDEQPDAASCEIMLAQCTTLLRQRITETTCSVHSRHPHRYCTAACNLCEEVLQNATCPLHIQEAPAFDSPDELFQRINLTTTTTTTQQQQQYGVVSIHPSLIVMDDFLSDAECQALIDCAAADFSPSQDIVSSRGRSYYYRARLSSRSHCDTTTQSSSNAVMIANIYRRIEAMTLVPHRNTEPTIQLVKYDVGHFHKPQSDTTTTMDGTDAGPRVMTILLFLNTAQGGGALHFPETSPNVTILPQKGRAVLWSNTDVPASSALDKKEDIQSAVHEILPVTEGVLYTAKIWIHARTVRTCKFIDDEQEAATARSFPAASSFQSKQEPEHAFA